MSQRAFLYTLAGVVIAVVIFTRIYFPTKPGESSRDREPYPHLRRKAGSMGPARRPKN